MRNQNAKGVDTMINSNRAALMAMCCALAVLLPTESFASLNNIACKAIRRSCNADCSAGDQSQACYSQCSSNYVSCFRGEQNKQQTPPPPCTGIRCGLRGANPPTTVGPPARNPAPVKPVQPVGVSNPNKTSTGNAPVILERKNDPGGPQHNESGGRERGH